jgi:hypothetical protein
MFAEPPEKFFGGFLFVYMGGRRQIHGKGKEGSEGSSICYSF